MRNVLTIAGKELRSYFSSPVAYVLIAAYLALAGYFFFALLTLLMVLLSGMFGVLLVAYGNPELPMMLAGYPGLALMATVFLTIGTLISSFTDNVVIAYVGALFALLVLYTIGWLGETVHGV